ncbi:MAG: T9SS type A sorting domain-containing protein, partial [Bacteroidota bacterium]
DLPAEAAFYWDQSDWVDLNYHIRNTDLTKVLAADFYMNVYTQPRGSGRIEMHAEIENNANIFLPPGVTTLEHSNTWGGDDRKIWMISSHTHKYGKDFDIYVRNPDGSKGDQIYEGYYNTTYDFNQGFYDWAHPAIRLFDTLYTVPQTHGLLMETRWDNTSNNFVFFGLTTEDEMQLMTMLYVNASDTFAVDQPEPTTFASDVVVYPNPAQTMTSVGFELERAAPVAVQVLDLTGREVRSIAPVMQSAGAHTVAVNLEGLESQMYFVRLTAGERSVVRKVFVTD